MRNIVMTMKRLVSRSLPLDTIVSILFLSMIVGCATVPHTERKQLNIIPEDLEISLGLDAYEQVLQESKLSRDREKVAMVRRVGQRIARVSDRPDYRWEFNVIDDDDTINAFCLPGGKVAVYTGILPVTKDETGLAVVLAHEVAHAIAHHAGERMTQSLGVNAAAILASRALEKHDAKTQQIVLASLGIGAQFGVILPFSRTHEKEADRIGLVYMAKAGYDPGEAAHFWERMEKAGGASPPEFLSTHPSHKTRIQEIKKYLPEALKYYKPNR
jgi:predicted Zn-dependent protease